MDSVTTLNKDYASPSPEAIYQTQKHTISTPGTTKMEKNTYYWTALQGKKSKVQKSTFKQMYVWSVPSSQA